MLSSAEMAIAFIRERYPILLCYLVMATYLAHFYIQDGVTMGKDGGAFLLVQTQSVLGKFFYIWQTYGHGVANMFDYMYAPFYLVLSLIGNLGFPATGLIYWGMNFFFGLLGAFLLAGKIIELFDLNIEKKWRDGACFLVSLVYVFSPIAVVYRWGDCNSQAMVYGLFALFTYFILDAIFETKLRRALAKAAAYSVFMFFFSFGLVNVGLVIAPAITAIFCYRKLEFRRFVIVAIFFILASSWLSSIALSKLAGLYDKPAGDVQNAEAWKDDWTQRYYPSQVNEAYGTMFYPISLYGGIKAYGGYYTQLPVLGLWLAFVVLALLATIMWASRISGTGYLVFCIVVFIAAASLSIMPKGPLSTIYNAVVQSPMLWMLKSAYDRFNFFLQFALLPLTLNYVILMTKSDKMLRMAGLSFFFLVIAVAGFPLISGQSAYDSNRFDSKAEPTEEVFGFIKELEALNSSSSDYWILYAPAVKGPWVKTEWYRGMDYAEHLPGRNSASNMRDANMTNQLITLVESDSLIADQGEQNALMKLLALGNYRYMVLRGDVLLSGQEYDPADPYIRNQMLNMRYVITRNNFTRVFNNGDPCISDAILMAGRTPWIRIRNVTHSNAEGKIRGDIIFRPMSEQARKTSELLFVVPGRLSLTYAESRGITLRANGMDGWKTYRADNVSEIQYLQWQNVSFDIENNRAKLLINGNRTALRETNESYGGDGMNATGDGILIAWLSNQGKSDAVGLVSEVRWEACGDDGVCEATVLDSWNDTDRYEAEDGIPVVADCISDNSHWGYEIYENPSVRGDVFQADAAGNIDRINYTYKNPAEFTVNGKISPGKTLVLSENYRPGWVAEAYKNGVMVMRQNAKPTFLNLIGFGFEGLGAYDYITVRYTPQDIVAAGRWISILTIIGGGIVLLAWDRIESVMAKGGQQHSAAKKRMRKAIADTT